MHDIEFYSLCTEINERHNNNLTIKKNKAIQCIKMHAAQENLEAIVDQI